MGSENSLEPVSKKKKWTKQKEGFWNNLKVIIIIPVATVLIGIFFVPVVETNNREAIEKADAAVAPAEVIFQGWEKWGSRFHEEEVPVDVLTKDKDILSSSPNAIGMPVSYYGQFQYDSDGDWHDANLAAKSQLFFTLKGTTERPAVVKEIRAVIEKTEHFSPETFYFLMPQGDSPRTEFGIDLGGPDLEAKQMNYSVITDRRYLSVNGSSLSANEATQYNVTILAPPGKKISFHLEFTFEGYSKPVRVNDNGSSLVAVGYPTQASPPLHTYLPAAQLPPYTHDRPPLECHWQVGCLSPDPEDCMPTQEPVVSAACLRLEVMGELPSW